MSFSEWLPVFAVCLLGAVSPGPSLAVVLRNTLDGSRLNGVVTGLGHCLGIGVYALVATTSLAVVITSSPALFRAITWAGAGYLFWLGVNAWRAAADGGHDPVEGGQSQISLLHSAKQGFLISFLNPKIAVFFLALFSQFVVADAALTRQVIMALTAVIVDGAWYTLVALAFSHPQLLPWLRTKTQVINRITCVVLIAIALKVLFI